jgi:hypothetical protein
MTQNTDPSVVYLLKSTYYPDFRQKILNLLSLPSDLQQIVEYDSKWVSEELREKPESFEGADACVMFVDYSPELLDFWPLRLCKVARIIPPVDGMTYQILLKLGEYRTATDVNEFSSKVREYLQQKQIIEKKGNENWPAKLVFSGDDSIWKMLAKVGEQQDTWEGIVKHLVASQDIPRGINQEQFKHSIFYKLGVLAREELGSPLRPREGVYQLDPGKQYSLVFAVSHPHYENFRVGDVKENAIDFPEGLLHHVGSKTCRLPTRQRKYTQYFDFWTKDLATGGKSEMSVRLEDDEFNGPSFHIPFILRPKRFQLASLFLTLAVGLLLLGSSGAIASMATSSGFTYLSQSSLEWIIGIFGTVLSLLPIAWLELKRSATL